MNSGKSFSFSSVSGGKGTLLFLLFLLAIYEFVTAGFSTFAIICLSPILVLVVIAIFKWRMAAFWTLIIVNYFISFKNITWPVPQSLPDEMLELLLIVVAIIDLEKSPHFERAGNIMLLAVGIWMGLCVVEIFNDTCGLGMNFSAWFTGARLMALQLLWILLVFSLYIGDAKTLMTYLRVWAGLALFSAFWTWKQVNIGFTTAEQSWLNSVGYVTHIINGGSLIRYWSNFSDAANYGCNAGATAVAFLIFGITSKIRFDKVFFLLTSFAVLWGMFQSGTRTAMFAFIGGFVVFLVVSKSFKIMIPSAILGGLFLMMLIFTDIGNGNQQIRRMRSAFDKSDASANVRDINQAAIAKYLEDAPWGIGIGIFANDIPARNKFRKLSEIPPDSEYVFIWVRTGNIGVSVFAFCMVLMLAGACGVVLFRLKSPSLIGVGGGFCSAFAAIQLAGYANQVIFQYPNGLIFFGGLAIVYVLPYIEEDWVKYEEGRMAAIAEKKRLKLEKKLAQRV